MLTTPNMVQGVDQRCLIKDACPCRLYLCIASTSQVLIRLSVARLTQEQFILSEVLPFRNHMCKRVRICSKEPDIIYDVCQVKQPHKAMRSKILY